MEAVYDRNALTDQRFNLQACEKKIVTFCQANHLDGVAVDNYFIMPKKLLAKEDWVMIDKENCYRVSQSKCQLASCVLLNKHQLVMGSYEGAGHFLSSDKAYSTALKAFKNIIIEIELYWVMAFSKIIQEHLKNRKFEKSVLINKAVQVMIDDVMNHIKSAEQYYQEARLNNNTLFDYQLSAIKELRMAMQLLAKLHGGKSFLSGNVIEMMMIFEYFRDIYFS